MKRNLLISTAVVELGTGAALLCRPSIVVKLLLGSELASPAGLVVARVAGAALLALGLACWLARHDGNSRATTGIVSAMLVYNVATVVVLGYAGIGAGLSGIGLWPAAGLHLAMAVWCVACLPVRKSVTTSTT